jgi:Coenzyme PQQ synthesis protein D (PqqD)
MEKYIQNKQVVQSKIGEEVVMLDMESGYYFGLNSMASVIWNMLQNAVTVEEIVGKLLTEYAVQESQCLAETQELIGRMLEHKIITCVTGD